MVMCDHKQFFNSEDRVMFIGIKYGGKLPSFITKNTNAITTTINRYIDGKTYVNGHIYYGKLKHKNRQDAILLFTPTGNTNNFLYFKRALLRLIGNHNAYGVTSLSIYVNDMLETTKVETILKFIHEIFSSKDLFIDPTIYLDLKHIDDKLIKKFKLKVVDTTK